MPQLEQRGALVRLTGAGSGHFFAVFDVRDSDGEVRASGAGPLEAFETASVSDWPEECWQ